MTSALLKKPKTILTILAQLLLWAEIIAGSTASIAQAATFNIANADVAGLINALNTANGNGVPDTINLAANGLYTLTAVNNTIGGANGLPAITSNITLNGNNATITRAPTAPNFRLIYVASGGTLQLNNLTISNGRVSPGGGLYNAGGQVILNHSAVINNLAFGTIQGVTGFAGGILNSGTLTLNNSTVSGNTATGGIEGNTGSTGGIGNSGTATLNDSTVSGNAAGDTGGIFNSGTLILNNSTISGNTAPMFNGGGISNTGALTLLNSPVSNNFAIEAGGGIYNTGSVATITDSLISGNTARDGGGIWNNGGMTLTDTTVSNNNATTRGGGIKNSGILTVRQSTSSGNTSSSGGGVYNDGGSFTLDNSTVANNTAHFGGGLWVGDGQVTLNHCTISGNSATYIVGTGYNGGGLLNASSQTVTVKNTILAGNTAQAQGPDCYNLTTLTSQGYNLIGNNAACTFATALGDQVGTAGSPIDPRLGPLQDNGGSTQTRALLGNSPASDAVAGGNCTDSLGGTITTDQRGQSRPLDGNGDGSATCDSGAYETPLLDLSSSASPNPAPLDQTIIYTYRIENTGAMTLTNLSARDDLLGSISLSSATLAPGQIITSTLSHVVVDADLPGPLVSNASVTGTTQIGGFPFTAAAPISVILIGPKYFPIILKNQ